MNEIDGTDARVFISGLPPRMTSDELGKHFACRCEITDAQVIPNRRIGFVGFKDHALAKAAVQYFNKSYIRMSRISVDLARPVEIEHESSKPKSGRNDPKTKDRHALSTIPRQNDGVANGRSQTYTPVPTGSHILKRKRSEADDPKLRDYLDVMQPTQKTKPDGDVIPDVPGSLTQGGNVSNTSQQDVAVAPRNERREKRHLAEGSHAMARDIQAGDSGRAATAHGGSTKDRPESEEHGNDHAPPVADGTTSKKRSPEIDGRDIPKTDADWLRSKTSRLLDFDDDDGLSSLVQPPRDTLPGLKDGWDQSSSGSESPIEDLSLVADGNAEPQIAEDADSFSAKFNERLFIRNLPYEAEEPDLERVFAKFGKLSEVHIVRDSRSNASKGFAYVEYIDSESSRKAALNLDGKVFQGRLLHVLPASAKRTQTLDEYELSKLPLKRQKLIKRKAEAASSTFNWNSLYMNPDAIMSSVADRLGVSKSEVLDPTSSDAAVKQAHAETHIIQETQSYLAANGVDLNAFKRRERGNTAILVKNFPYGVTLTELKAIFEPFGQVSRAIFPPSGTMAIIEYRDPGSVQQAFRNLAYRNFKGSPLFLEKAPKNLLTKLKSSSGVEDSQASAQDKTAMVTQSTEQDDQVDSSTLFVRNLNFATTSTGLTESFKPLDGFRSATVKTRSDPKKPGQILSMGFGFVEFQSKRHAQAALTAMNGHILDKHELQIKASTKATDAAEERRKEDQTKKSSAKRTKIIIKNLPFEASKKDIRGLFGSYGQLRSVRVPKKFDNSTRGFGFADFVTPREAENAMDALSNTHLLGRRLVLQFAAEDALDPEDEIQAIEKKVGDQANRVRLKNLVGSGRKKFSAEARDEIERI